MKTILATLLTALLCAGFLSSTEPQNAGAPHDCNTQGHIYGPWYKQAQMFYINEQPAHICKVCGSFQNMSGRFMQLVSPKEVPGGLGTLSKTETEALTTVEVLKDFGTWEKYNATPVTDGYSIRQKYAP